MRKATRILFKFLVSLFVILNIIVAFHAYKFTHFYNPGEVVIKPAAQKTGWDKTKEILFGFNAIKQQNQVADSNYKTIYFTTLDNLKLEAWYMPADSTRGTVALFHGHGSKKSAVLSEAAVFHKLGYNTILLDFRAHGNSEGNTTTIGYKEAEDVKLVYDYLKEKHEQHIILYGISMGASTITKAINDYQLEPEKIILDMPFASLPDAVVGRVKMMKLPAQPISTLLTFWGGVEHGFWAFNMKPAEYAKKIICPVLLQRGAQDNRVTQNETEWIYQNISTEKKLVIYQSAGHESLCKKEPEKWQQEVAAFLK
ncbi:MAG: alpha/beta hydrolase [Ferruginibacter sp.]